MTPEQVLDYPFADPPAPGTTRQVAPGVRWLRMPLPYVLNHINLWLLEDGPDRVIVDCGVATDETRALWDRILDASVGERRVSRVLVTHCHPDHAGNAGWLAGRLGAPLWMSQAEYLTAHAWRDDAAGYTHAGWIAFARAHGLDEARIASLEVRGSRYKRVVPEFPYSYHRIMDSDEIMIGGRAWQVIMGYGHAPEHASLYCAELDVFISGDMLLPKISTNVGVSSVTPGDDPLGQFLDSIARYRGLLSERTLVLPSHGLPFRGAHERITQLEEHHRMRLAELEEACGEPRSAAELIGTVFRRELDPFQTFLALGETLAHLNYLARRGALMRAPGADGVVRFVAPA
jgi:glyoxylase-like metal-dependent hydrolase (beta-lactamase superfamily II)